MKKLLAAVVVSLIASACSPDKAAQTSTVAAHQGSSGKQVFTSLVPTGASTTGLVAISPIQAKGLIVRVNCSISISAVSVSFDHVGFNDAFGPLIAAGAGKWQTSGQSRTFRGVQIQTWNSYAPQYCTYSIEASETPTIAFSANGAQLSCLPYTGPVLPCAFNPAMAEFENACREAGYRTVSCDKVGGCGVACSGYPY